VPHLVGGLDDDGEGIGAEFPAHDAMIASLSAVGSTCEFLISISCLVNGRFQYALSAGMRSDCDPEGAQSERKAGRLKAVVNAGMLCRPNDPYCYLH
jgi:hypothetical protein